MERNTNFTPSKFDWTRTMKLKSLSCSYIISLNGINEILNYFLSFCPLLVSVQWKKCCGYTRQRRVLCTECAIPQTPNDNLKMISNRRSSKPLFDPFRPKFILIFSIYFSLLQWVRVTLVHSLLSKSMTIGHNQAKFWSNKWTLNENSETPRINRGECNQKGKSITLISKDTTIGFHF